jgi:hypothetical protein
VPPKNATATAAASKFVSFSRAAFRGFAAVLR